MIIFNLITVSIVCLNLFLRYLIIFLVRQIGLKTESLQMMHVCSKVFYTQLINTGFMTILSNANFKNTPLEFIPIYNNYQDFSEEWYTDVGSTIVQTMFIQSIMPYANMIAVIAEVYFYRFMDIRCKDKSTNSTKAKTIQ